MTDLVLPRPLIPACKLPASMHGRVQGNAEANIIDTLMTCSSGESAQPIRLYAHAADNKAAGAFAGVL